MVRSVGLSVTEGGEGKADPRLGQGVEVGEEAGETGDKKALLKYLMEGRWGGARQLSRRRERRGRARQ